MSKDLREYQVILRDNQKFLAKAYNVRRLGIFGSFVNGRPSKKSDVDILVELAEPMGLLRFVELEQYLSKTLDRKVDLATKEALKPAIKGAVLKDLVYV